MIQFECCSCHQTKNEEEFGRKPGGKRKRACKPCCKAISQRTKEGMRNKREYMVSAGAGDRPRRWALSYVGRNAVLKQLGFASYQDYLASPLWQEIRQRVFAQKGRDCYLCGRPACQVHHERYTAKALRGKRTRHLWPICPDCHRGIEFDGERKRPVAAVLKITKRIRKGRKKSSPPAKNT